MEFRLLQKEWKFYFVPLEIVYVYVNECTYACVYNLNTYITLIFVESLPSMDQVTVNVAGFASRVHSFDILVESCMHGVAKNKEEKKKKKEKRKKKNINTIVLIYSTGYFLKEKHQKDLISYAPFKQFYSMRF